MKKLIIILTLLSSPAFAKAKFAHMEATTIGWHFLYYDHNEPMTTFVPKCSETMVDNCGWNRTSAKALADKRMASEARQK